MHAPFEKSSGFRRLVATAALVCLALAPGWSRADIVRTATSVTFSGSISNAGVPVTVEAMLSIDPGQPDILTLLLRNTSTAATSSPAGLLTSFYFGVYSGTTSGTAPTLGYLSGTGQVYQPVRSGTDIPGIWTPPAVAGGSGTFTPGVYGPSDLKATKAGDFTWQFRSSLTLVASEPPLNFGIGTVGNTNLSPNNFNGSIVDGNDFGIYAGDATAQSVESAGLLVSGSAVFRFSGFSPFTASQIPSHAVFGLGSGPDLVVTVPEPGGAGLLAIGATAALGWSIRRRIRARGFRRACWLPFVAWKCSPTGPGP